MKCAICGKRTNWDESYGYDEFIVCPHCFDKIKEMCNDDISKALDIVFKLGRYEKIKKILKDSWQITFNLIYSY